MQASYDSVDELAAALRRAEAAHGRYEKETGPDPDWPAWYAQYMVDEQAEGAAATGSGAGA
jgi:hypothetical protein